MKPITREAYQLLHDGSIMLSEVEANGMRIDMGKLLSNKERVASRVKELTNDMKEDVIYNLWRRRYRDKVNLSSRTQLGTVLFEDAGFQSQSRTRTGRAKADEESLSYVDSDFVRKWLEVESLKKTSSTFLSGIQREVVDGLIHPVFNLHLVKTYRSSSDTPNFQNFPVRDKEQSKIVRECFIPRDGHVLAELDFKALEVRIAACYHKDPTMISYINDPSKDMHKDMAAECYTLNRNQVTKDARFSAKNAFVFPEFYGSYYAQCAPDLWNNIDKLKLKTTDGVPMKEHLTSAGIAKLGRSEDPQPGTFMRHIKVVENRFWNERFSHYTAWKDWWVARYERLGYFDMVTGFRETGLYVRNDVINHPVQGPAFHCLLWSMIRIHNWLKKYRMRSLLVGEIHDSMVADVHESELEDFVNAAKHIMEVSLRKAWKWIIVPLEVEVEVGRENWYGKESMAI